MTPATEGEKESGPVQKAQHLAVQDRESHCRREDVLALLCQDADPLTKTLHDVLMRVDCASSRAKILGWEIVCIRLTTISKQQHMIPNLDTIILKRCRIQ